MAETAKQIDFSQSGNSRISTGGVWSYSVQPFLIFYRYQDSKGERTYVSAGVGADGLCNEPTYDVHRELVKAGDEGPPYPEEYDTEGLIKAITARKTGRQWNTFCQGQGLTSVKISGYSCFLLKGFPAWGSHARTVSFDVGSN